MKLSTLTLSVALLLGASLWCIAPSVAADDKQVTGKVFYRYKDNNGVKAVGQSIPPQFIRNGYDIVSVGGEVLKTVAPAPSESDAERIYHERLAAKEQAKADLQLRRSYSMPAEIDAAKARTLLDLNNSIAILKASLQSVKTQLKAQESAAATMERSGQAASEDVLHNVANLRAEEKETLEKIHQREVDYQQVANKFDQDKQRFLELQRQQKQ